MKIRLTTSIGVWLDDQCRGEGYETTVDDEMGKAMIERGHASQIHTRNRKKKTDAPAASAE